MAMALAMHPLPTAVHTAQFVDTASESAQLASCYRAASSLQEARARKDRCSPYPESPHLPELGRASLNHFSLPRIVSRVRRAHAARQPRQADPLAVMDAA